MNGVFCNDFYMRDDSAGTPSVAGVRLHVDV